MRVQSPAVLVAGAFLLLNSTVGLIVVTAQTLTTLHDFNGNDGAGSVAGLILSGTKLYGTTTAGGTSSNGTLFVLNTDGTGFTNLHSFDGSSDGGSPHGSLILSGDTLYGTALNGGGGNVGTVFAVNTDGTGFTNLYAFPTPGFQGTNTSGANPWATLTLSGDTLYGTTSGGGATDSGTVFCIKTNGTEFTNIHSFWPGRFFNEINQDGTHPYCALLLSGETLYGTARNGGGFNPICYQGCGTVFAINLNDFGLTPLHSFTFDEGSFPWAGLIVSDGVLYGTTLGSTLFRIAINGADFAVLHAFASGTEGFNPFGRLVLSGESLYGSCTIGGTAGNGTLFRITTNGTDFTVLHTFSAGGTDSSGNYTNSDGARPTGELIFSNNICYGTTSMGGASGSGTVFSLFIQPQLTINYSGGNVILTWPTNYPGFILQSTTNLASPVWATNSAASVIVDGQYTVTNAISDTRLFYRLSH